MFIGIITYTQPLEEVDRVLEAHREYLQHYFASGHFISCGRLVPRTGGMVMARAKNREEMIRIFQQDPFCTQGVARYEVIEYAPTQWAEGFEGFKTV